MVVCQQFARPLAVTLLLAAGLVALTGCPEDQVLTSTRNLSRPGPLAMVCAGKKDDGTRIGLPASYCSSTASSELKGYLYGFVANTARSEVAVFRTELDAERLVDLDPGIPGYGFIPVGSYPTQAKASADGCRVVTVNSGSCDLSVIDVPQVLQVASNEITKPTGALVSSVVPRTADGPLRARPQEMVMIPLAAPKKATDACPARTDSRAYMTFPRCNLVAEVDLSTGKLVRGLILRPDGVEITDRPSCPAECIMRGETTRVDSGVKDLTARPADIKQIPDAPASDSKPTDAGVADASPNDSAAADAGVKVGDSLVAGASGVLPYGLAYNHEDRQLYVSTAGAGFVAVIDIDTKGAFSRVRRIQLGVATTRIKLSPRTRHLGRFLYAIASDRSVRVISTSVLRECETNLDLARAPEAGVPIRRAGCQVVGANNSIPRRATSKTPGLRFGEWIPRDIEFITGPELKDQPDGHLATPIQGIYALIAVSDGTVYVVDVEDWSVVKSGITALSGLQLPHRVRNGQRGIDQGVLSSVSGIADAGSGGVPVVVNETTQKLPNGGIYMRAPGQAVTASWNLVYEGLVASRWSGSLGIESGRLVLNDLGANFCARGVRARKLKDGIPLEHGDILVLRGCENDDQCGIEQVCAKSVSITTKYGLCLEKARETELFTKCIPFLNARREYVINRATKDQLGLDLLHEPQKVIVQDPSPQCGSNKNCKPPYPLCALKDQGQNLKKGDCFRSGCMGKDDCSSQLCLRPLDGSPNVCSPVPLPFDTPGPACDSTAADPDAKCKPPSGSKQGARCSKDADCGDARLECRRPSTAETEKTCVSKGYRCARFAGLKDICVRISPCLAELQPYEVRSGGSFLVRGTTYRKSSVDAVTGLCKNDDKSMLSDRIPVGLPIYPVVVGPECYPPSVKPLQTPQPNACFDQTKGYSGYHSQTSSDKFGSISGSDPAVVVRFTNPEIWFSMGVSHLRESTPTASVDGGVPASNTPNMPSRELTITLSVSNGYAPLRASTAGFVSLPSRLVEGPDGWVYVVDMGDTAGGTGNNGQVRRFSRESITLDNFQVR